ncbi:MAG: FG-GAP-like repeat-containing protein, partial [Bacteroidota bacterium]
AGSTLGEFFYFENTAGPGATPAFASFVTGAFGLSDIGDYSQPTVADLDGDGDLDVLSSAGSSGDVAYFENTAGPDATPAFAAPETNPFGLSLPNPSAFAAMGDLDGDGDVDVLGRDGDSRGFRFHANTPETDGTPSFGAGVDNPFGLTDIGLNVKMAIGDLDGDGDLDVIATSSQSTELFFYENTPQPDGTPSFSRSTNPFGLSGVTFNADNSQPTLGDLDGDGDMDILVGQYYSAGFLYFENTPGTDGVPSFTSVVENPFGLTATPGYSGLDVGQTGAIVDLDGDG